MQPQARLVRRLVEVDTKLLLRRHGGALCDPNQGRSAFACALLTVPRSATQKADAALDAHDIAQVLE